MQCRQEGQWEVTDLAVDSGATETMHGRHRVTCVSGPRKAQLAKEAPSGACIA